MRFSRNSQFAKFGSISTFKSVNWIRNDAWPIQVMATSPGFNLGKTGRCCSPVRGVSKAFQTSSRKNVRGIEMLRRRQILERARQLPARGDFGEDRFVHKPVEKTTCFVRLNKNKIRASD